MKGIVLSLTLTIVIAAAAMGIARAVGDRTEVRILAQRLDDGRTEFGLQYREADDTWSDTVLPHRRYFPADPEVGNWLVSSGVMVQQRPPSPLPVDGLYGTEAWQPYRDDTYFVRCPSTIEDEHIHVAIVAVGPAYYDHPCLKPDGAVQLYYNNDFDKLISIRLVFELPPYIEMRGYDYFINGEPWFDTLGEGGLQYTRRTGYGGDYLHLLHRVIPRPENPFVNGVNKIQIAIYGHWPTDHFCDAWYEHQRQALNRPHGNITSCRGDDRLADPEYRPFVLGWNEGELSQYTIDFDLEVRW